MDNIDIEIDLSDPLPKDYYRQFVVVREQDLKRFDQQKVSFVLFKIIRKNDTKPVFVIADIIKSDELTMVLRNPPKMPILYSGVKNDIKKVDLVVKNGRYVFSHIMAETYMKHPLFSILNVDNINVLTRSISVDDIDELEKIVNGWFENENK